MTNSPRHN